MRSKFEENVGKLLKKHKVKYKYEPCALSYVVERNYTPDFKVGNIFIETKGRFTSADRTKMLKVKEHNPDVEIKLWFMQDNWLTKAKKKRYSDWATYHGFDWHVGLIFPEHWFE